MEPFIVATHRVENQPPLLEDYNLYERNRPLQEALVRDGAGWAAEQLHAHGAELGSRAWIERGTAANRNPPTPQLFERTGQRRDEFEFHPAWHDCLTYLKRNGCATGPWSDPRPGAHVSRAALFELFAEIECGSMCPTTMTYGAVPAIRREPALARDWLPKILAPEYDPRFIPVADKRGALIGMGMTEKQGGSDIRANTTRAEHSSSGGWQLIGHKWFFSAPMCDAFLVTAQAPDGLSCFFVPRYTPDGARNEIRIQRAKDKLGDRSNASAEVEFFGAHAELMGEEGRGIPTILEMGTYTRLDCAIGSAGIMRQCLSQALHHASYRAAFGKLLREQPLMANLLADLALESEAATALTLRLARAFDAQDNEAEQLLRRILTPAAKFWICKRGPAFSAEAMEVLGGNGYVEESVMPRLYRQMPLNSIWEGSGNIMCLDVLRAMAKEPRTIEALLAEIESAAGRDPDYDAFLQGLKREFADPKDLPARARWITQNIALAVQAALLLCHAPDYVASAFCATRLRSTGGQVFGALPRALDSRAILDRAWPL